MNDRRLFLRSLVLLVVLVLASCQPDPGNNGSGPLDTGPLDIGFDAGLDVGDTDVADALDSSDEDASGDTGGETSDGDSGVQDTDSTDTSSSDTGSLDADTSDTTPVEYPLDGFGTLSGDCDVLDEELTASMPAYVENALDFGMDPYDESDKSRLTTGGMEIIDDGNAGGSSLLSEVFAYEVLYRCELAALIKTETEIQYADDQGKITDLLVEIDGFKIGVSVTRAVDFPFEDPYTVEQANTLLTDKLQDVQSSSQNVLPGDAWEKQILHVIAYAPGHEDSIETAFSQLDASVKADTILWVTVSNGEDAFLY